MQCELWNVTQVEQSGLFQLLLLVSVLVTSSFLFLVVRPGAPLIASLLLVVLPFAPNSVLGTSKVSSHSLGCDCSRRPKCKEKSCGKAPPSSMCMRICRWAHGEVIQRIRSDAAVFLAVRRQAKRIGKPSLSAWAKKSGNGFFFWLVGMVDLERVAW